MTTRPEEADQINQYTIVGVTAASHRGENAGFPQRATEGQGAILPAAVGVVDEARPGPAARGGHPQGVDDEVRCKVVAHRPAAAEARVGVGFEIETLINIRVAQAGLHVVEVPSYERSRLYGVSNLNAITDGLRVLRTIICEYRRARARLRLGQRTSRQQPKPPLGVLPHKATGAVSLPSGASPSRPLRDR